MGEVGNTEGGGVGTAIVGVAKAVVHATAEKFFGTMPEVAPVAKPLGELIDPEKKQPETILQDKPPQEERQIENIRQQLKGIPTSSESQAPQPASSIVSK